MSIDWNEVETYSAMAAVCLNTEWRFFYDDDFMFILDWIKYDGEDNIQNLSEETFRPLIVNSQNAPKWMSKLAGELTSYANSIGTCKRQICATGFRD